MFPCRGQKDRERYPAKHICIQGLIVSLWFSISWLNVLNQTKEDGKLSKWLFATHPDKCSMAGRELFCQLRNMNNFSYIVLGKFLSIRMAFVPWVKKGEETSIFPSPKISAPLLGWQTLLPPLFSVLIQHYPPLHICSAYLFPSPISHHISKRT